MKYSLFLLPIIALASCSVMETSPITTGAKACDYGKIGAGEGPAWKDGFLYFTDGTHINRLNAATGKTTVFLAQCGNANGLMFDHAGRLIMCESKGKRVTRLEKNGKLTVLAAGCDGMKFNSPNDLTMDSQGHIYFTDPCYGPRDGMQMRDAQGRLVEAVYRIDPPIETQAPRPQRYNADKMEVYNHVSHTPARVTRILSLPQVDRPNGILVSPGDQYLYICDNNNNTHGGSRKLLRFDLNTNGTVRRGSRKVIFDWTNGRGPDGMKMDARGRLYVMAGVNRANDFETNKLKAGCYIFSPGGRLTDVLGVAPDEATNCAFGSTDFKTLYMTSGNHLWSVPLNTSGWSVGER